ncbi:MAG: sugar phosphate isomerase/epimerase family protein [Planctomycetota bacterium]|jgi:sugar phosphate isomerase/epimerase
MTGGRRNVVSRREFLKAGALAAGAGIAGPLAAREAWAVDRKKIGLAVQLYSVRGDCKKDFDGTVRAVGEMGYEGVEFAGYGRYGRDPKGLRKLLDDCGLKVAGTHTGFNTLTGDNLKRTIEFHKIIGNRFLIAPSLPGNRRNSLDAWRKTADMFNEMAEKAKADDMLVGYHNHSVEFKRMDGQVPWDIYAGNTSKEVVLQLDTGNCLSGGGDPVAYLKKYPGRAVTTHLKEHGGRNALIGDGVVKWREYLPLCEKVGGTEWFIVEQERYPKSPLESIKICLANLKRLLGRR